MTTEMAHYNFHFVVRNDTDQFSKWFAKACRPYRVRNPQMWTHIVSRSFSFFKFQKVCLLFNQLNQKSSNEIDIKTCNSNVCRHLCLKVSKFFKCKHYNCAYQFWYMEALIVIPFSFRQQRFLQNYKALPRCNL